ncbi:Eukaryotic translation initiation factor 3 subunit G-B [Camellia lanceoleosa]|uniref:Eukaryotic translation initiation factor 3 subunit G-B n=1 Tax=Camellia lanceoleosa TaxID=1840588 RepID=A0ACC0HP82_9ERIC|nr:Eukaryotic translation initiation factor 3 subunit G-B [Camellia lanceoleosa]
MAISDSTSLQSSLSSQQPKKLRWSEIKDDDEVDLCFLLSPPRLIDSNEIKITPTTTRFNKRVVERRSWAKLCDAVNDDVNSRLTMVSTEEIVLERRSASGGKAEETSTRGDSLAQHDRPPSADATAASSIANNSTYVPPSRRAGSERSIGSDMRRKNNENAIRIGNLSEDAQDTHLVELCRPFGQVVRAHIPKDYKTGSSRGYGFVNFICKEDVERAIEKLNGYGYDNLILSVEWSARTK